MVDAWNEIRVHLQRERLLDACDLNAGATSAELAHVAQHIGQSLPQEVCEFLSEHNGQKTARQAWHLCGKESAFHRRYLPTVGHMAFH